MRWHRKGLMPGPGDDWRLTKNKIAWARHSLCLKWWVVLRAGVNQYPSHLTKRSLEGWKRWPSSSLGATEGGGPLAWSRPMDEFSLGDREGDAYVPALCGDCIEESLQFADVASVGRGGHGDQKVVDVGDHESLGNRHMQGRNI